MIQFFNECFCVLFWCFQKLLALFLVSNMLPLHRTFVQKSSSPMKFTLSLIFLFVFSLALAQQKATISGYITDARSGEALGTAKVFVQELKSGTVVNNYGFYSLTLPVGVYQIEFRCDGFVTINKSVELKSNQTISLELEMAIQETKEVRVTGKKSENVTSAKLGQMELKMDQVKTLPAFMSLS